MYFAHFGWNLRTQIRIRQEQSFSNAYKCVRHYEQTVEKQSVFEIKATNTGNKCVKKIVSACACVSETENLKSEAVLEPTMYTV